MSAWSWKRTSKPSLAKRVLNACAAAYKTPGGARAHPLCPGNEVFPSVSLEMHLCYFVAMSL